MPQIKGPEISFDDYKTDVTSALSDYAVAAAALHDLTSSADAVTAATYATSLAAATANLALKGYDVIARHRNYYPTPEWAVAPTILDISPNDEDPAVVSSCALVSVHFDKRLNFTPIDSATFTAVSSASSVYCAAWLQGSLTWTGSVYLALMYFTLAPSAYYHIKVNSDDIKDLYGNFLAKDYVQSGDWYTV